MTKKEAIIKYISEMNTDMLSLILDDDKSYMDVPKDTFLRELDSTFTDLKNQGIHKFTKILEGHCGGDCNNGCGGHSFLTKDQQSLDLIFEEEDNEIKDLYTCSLFINEEDIENRRAVYISFYDDEKTDYIPTSRHIDLQRKIDSAFSEFRQFKSDIIDLESYCHWSHELDKLYHSIDIIERMNLKFVNKFQELVFENSRIKELITGYPIANKAMKEFRKIDTSNEKSLVEWVLKYEEFDLYLPDHKKVNNWEENNLILHPLDNTIVIDCSTYAEALHFSEFHPKHHYQLLDKYDITREEFYEAKAKAPPKTLKCNLISFLRIHGKHLELEIFKTERKPIHIEFIIGNDDATTQFVRVAGKELGMNVKLEFIDLGNTYKNEKGEIKTQLSPEQIEMENENKIADKYYSNEIGSDWKLKIQKKIVELTNKNQINKCPF